MAKITVCKKSDFTVLDNGIFRDKRLSLKARGLLVTMLSLPEEWNYTIEGLSIILKEGKDCVRGALNELEECKYLVRNRTRNEKGQLLDTEYIVYEKPLESAENRAFEPKSENPTLDNPTLGKPTQLNKHKSNKQKESKHLNGLHRPEAETSGQSVAPDDFDFEIVKRQIKKEANNLGYGEDKQLIEAITRVFEYYYSKYYLNFGESHTLLSRNSMQNVIMRYIEGSDVAQDLQYDPDSYYLLIDKHFSKDYGKEIDYSICHFMTEGIRNCLYYEVLY